MSTPSLPQARVVDVLLPEDLPGLGLAVPVPVVDLGGSWSDERETCRRVHAYLAGDIDGRPTDYTDCTSYKAGRCAGNGWRTPCLFHEDETSPGWQRARGWVRVLLSDGTTAVQRRQAVAMEMTA